MHILCIVLKRRRMSVTSIGSTTSKGLTKHTYMYTVTGQMDRKAVSLHPSKVVTREALAGLPAPIMTLSDCLQSGGIGVLGVGMGTDRATMDGGIKERYSLMDYERLQTLEGRKDLAIDRQPCGFWSARELDRAGSGRLDH